MEQAIHTLERLLSHHPENIDGLVMLGELLMIANRIPEAQAHFQRVVELQPDNPLGYVMLGKAAVYYQQEYAKGIEYANKALELNPDEPQAHAVLGTAFKELGWYESAIDEYKRQTEIEPANPSALFDLALMYLYVESFRNAARTLEQAACMKAPPDLLKDIYVNLSVARQALGHQKKTAEALRQVISLCPGDISLY